VRAAITAGINIEYEIMGDPNDPPVLLMMGLGAQLTSWDSDFCDALCNRGYYVVRYDHRDVGLSSWFDDSDKSGSGEPVYSLSDMASDALGLLDVLNVETAHIVGLSMGGLIAQTFAINYPMRIETLVSIMSSTGSRVVGRPRPEALAALRAPTPRTRDEAIEQSVTMWKTIWSPRLSFDEQYVRGRAGAAYDRAFHPSGSIRHWAAVIAQPDRTEELRKISTPTLVIHGDADILVDCSGGMATAEAIPNAQLMLIPGMGHHLPRELFDELATAMAGHFTGDRILPQPLL
jgi:pimeloyl-ACP methyl ester carboxylesterase